MLNIEFGEGLAHPINPRASAIEVHLNQCCVFLGEQKEKVSLLVKTLNFFAKSHSEREVREAKYVHMILANEGKRLDTY